MKLAPLTVLLFSGCGAMPSERDQRIAIASIWFGAYAAPWEWAPPRVLFVGDRCLETYDGRCVDGLFHGRSAVADVPEAFEVHIGLAPSIHGSALAHELRHAWHWRRSHGKDSDETHVSIGWRFAVAEAEADISGL